MKSCVGEIVGEAARRDGVACELARLEGIGGGHLRGTIRVGGFRCGRARRHGRRAPCPCRRAARRPPRSSIPGGRDRPRRGHPRARGPAPSSCAARRSGAGSKGESVAAVLAAAGSSLATARSIRRSEAKPGSTHEHGQREHDAAADARGAARDDRAHRMQRRAAGDERDHGQRDGGHLPVPVDLGVCEHAGRAHGGAGERRRRLLAPAQQARQPDRTHGAAEQQARDAERRRELLQLSVSLRGHLAAVALAEVGRSEAARRRSRSAGARRDRSQRPSRSPSDWTRPRAGAARCRPRRPPS